MGFHSDNFGGAAAIKKLWVKPSPTTEFSDEEWSDPRVPKDCYAYGINIPEIGDGAIGRIAALDNGGADISSPDAVRKLLKQDELVEQQELSSDHSHVIAVFWTPSGKGHGRPDFHVYRRDSYGEGSCGDALWSHLYIEGSGCGATAKPSQYDHSDNPIYDPLACDHGRNNYKFVGYFAFNDAILAADSPGLQIVPKVDIDPNANQTTFTTYNNPVDVPGRCMTLGEVQRGYFSNSSAPKPASPQWPQQRH